MGRMGIRLVAAATAAVCLAACMAGGAPAARADGGKTIAEEGSKKM